MEMVQMVQMKVHSADGVFLLFVMRVSECQEMGESATMRVWVQG